MKNIAPLSLFVLFLSALAIGQDARVENNAPPGGCSNEFARFLVDQQVTESRSVAQKGKRVRILIRSADFAWKFDQPTARAYFSEAFKVATEFFAEKGFDNEQDKSGIITLAPDYRFEVIRAIAIKDPAWAKRLIEQLDEGVRETAGRAQQF